MNRLTLMSILQLCTTLLFSQNNVGIGTPAPDASAILDLKTLHQGFLMPRIINPLTDITAPANGLMAYHLGDGSLYTFRALSGWKRSGFELPYRANSSSVDPVQNSVLYLNYSGGTSTNQAIKAESFYGNGILAQSQKNIGVLGFSGEQDGVYGHSEGAIYSSGIRGNGYGNARGVYGYSLNAVGVHGFSASTGNTPGVRGEGRIGIEAISNSLILSHYGLTSYGPNGLKSESNATDGKGIVSMATQPGGIGLESIADHIGVYGSGEFGLYGNSTIANGIGVYGSVDGPNSTAIKANAYSTNSTGIEAYSQLGNGIESEGNLFGIRSEATGTSGIGVEGLANSTTGIGIRGSSSYIGVQGTGNQIGIDGNSFNPNGVGVKGYSLNSNGKGVYAIAQGANSSALHAEGNSTNGYGVFASGSTGVYSVGTVGVHSVSSSSSGEAIFAQHTNFGTAIRATTGLDVNAKGVDANGYIGVKGSSLACTGYGVLGESICGIGVKGISTDEKAIEAKSTNYIGIQSNGGTMGIESTGGTIGVKGIGPKGVEGVASQDGGAGISGSCALANGVAGSFIATTSAESAIKAILTNTSGKAAAHLVTNSGSNVHLLLEETEDDYARIDLKNTNSERWAIGALPKNDNQSPDAKFSIYYSDLDNGAGGDALILEGNGNLTLPAGDAYKPGGGPWLATSDARLKNNIHNYQDGLATVKAIEPKTYTYNEKSGYNTKETHIGVIAQDIQKIAPYMIEKNKKGYLQVDPNAFTYMLINAVKELSNENEKLKSSNADLSSRLDKIEALLFNTTAQK